MKKRFFVFFIFIVLMKLFSQDATNDSVNKNSNANQTVRVKNGWDYYNEGRFYESIKALLEEKKYFPDRVNIYVILGWDYLNLNDYESAEKISVEGLKYAADDLRIMKNIIDAYYYQKKYAELVPHLEKYISFRYNANDPYLATLYYYLGISFLNLGSYRKADVSLSTALHYNPNDLNTLIQLAETMIKLNQIEKAKKFFNSALKIQPNSTEAADGLKRLENIK
jgi:tetratricopeptide (TPR) repeat protein